MKILQSEIVNLKNTVEKIKTKLGKISSKIAKTEVLISEIEDKVYVTIDKEKNKKRNKEIGRKHQRAMSQPEQK